MDIIMQLTLAALVALAALAAIVLEMTRSKCLHFSFPVSVHCLDWFIFSSPVADIRTIAPTCLHIGGVQGAIEDEAKLVDIFSRFGTVLAVTLRIRREGKKVSWALVSFSSVSEADSCLAGMGELAKQHPGLVARQVDENQVG